MAPSLILSDGREVSNKKEPLDLSLVVTCYNQSQTIENTLSDWYFILQDLAVRFEILVINKGSRDGTGRVLDQMRKNLEHLRVVHQLPSQEAQARLRGFKLSRGAHVLLLPLDCAITADDFKKIWEESKNKVLVLGKRLSRTDNLFHLPYAYGLKKYLEKAYSCRLKDPGTPVQLFKRQFVILPKETESIPLSYWIQQVLRIGLDFPEQVSEIPIHLYRTSWVESPYEKLSLSSKIFRELLETNLKNGEKTIGINPASTPT